LEIAQTEIKGSEAGRILRVLLREGRMRLKGRVSRYALRGASPAQAAGGSQNAKSLDCTKERIRGKKDTKNPTISRRDAIQEISSS
jgi:hypothetical protein